jgi:hypothetical protein
MSIHEVINQVLQRGLRNIPLRQKGKKENSQDKRTKEDYPKVPSGFQCFECGRQFDTNEDRIQHLEIESHGGNYDTGSPQEREDTRRLR